MRLRVLPRLRLMSRKWKLASWQRLAMLRQRCRCLTCRPPQTPKPRQDRSTTVQLPAVVDVPTRTALLPVVQPKDLTEAQIAEAYNRIALGEKIGVVAPDFGLSFGVLRAMWANHKRQLQKHLAEGGQEACIGCGKMFTPSITSPDKCARCSHE